MLLKRILIGILCAVIVAGGVFYGVTHRFFDPRLSKEQEEEFKAQIALPDNFTIAASCNGTTAVKNSMEAVEECVQSGCYAVELNISFTQHGTPYLADGPEYLNASSVPLEAVFKKYADADYLRYLLHVENIIYSQKLYNLTREYNLFGRIILTGFSLEDIDTVVRLFPSFRIGYTPDTAFVNLQDKADCEALISRFADISAYALSFSAEKITAPLVEAIRESPVSLLMLEDADCDYDIFYALSLNPDIVISSRPQKLYDIMQTEQYLDFRRYENF